MRSKRHHANQKQAVLPPKQRRLLLAVLLLAGSLTFLVASYFFFHSATLDSNQEASPPLDKPQNKSSSHATINNAPLVLSWEEQRARLVRQLEEVDHTLCSYEESSQYPLHSRPIAEHADQTYPNEMVVETQDMRLRNGGKNPDIQVEASQSRVYMAARESVLLQLRAFDASQQKLPLFVTQAVAQGLTFQSGKAAPIVSLAMADNGRDGDLQAGDGIVSTRFSPATTGLAQFHGTIRVEVQYSVNGQLGRHYFDLIYTPELPAQWAGKITEAIENGALVFHLPLQVHKPGRYIVNARLDDAQGVPFALLNFNQLLPQGVSEIRFVAAGNLLRDKEASFPMRLRDIDGYLLKEDVDPDRELLPRLEGIAHQSKLYALKAFSDAVWDGEERQRHLKEFRKDVSLAQAALVALDPDQARRPFPQSACSKERARLAR